MINTNTVFILGAGASCPYGFPSGAKLREDICKLFDMQFAKYLDYRKVRDIYKEDNLLRANDFTSTFFKSSTTSIDLFLTRNPIFKDIGKLSIIFRIMESERCSKFRENMQKKEYDWYSFLFNKMTDEINKKEDYVKFSSNSISFITFNYDRSLEFFLFESFMNSFSEILEEEKIGVFNKIKFYHVYGQIAKLSGPNAVDSQPYGEDIKNLSSPLKLSNNIRIINEERSNPELEEIKIVINKAENLFFLGFSYAKENLEILDIPNVLHEGQNINGTALGLSNRELDSVKGYLLQNLNHKRHPKIHRDDLNLRIDLDCLALLKEYL